MLFPSYTIAIKEREGSFDVMIIICQLVVNLDPGPTRLTGSVMIKKKQKYPLVLLCCLIDKIHEIILSYFISGTY